MADYDSEVMILNNVYRERFPKAVDQMEKSLKVSLLSSTSRADTKANQLTFSHTRLETALLK